MAHAVLLLASVAVLTGAVISTIAIWLMAWSVLHPPRMTDGKALYVLRRLSPADIGLPFETLNFVVRDEDERPLKIAGWWIPNAQASGRCAILLHGYADAKVGALAWAPMWHRLGYNLYIPDLRAHGESGGSVCSGGFFERHDVAQVVDQLRKRYPDHVDQIVLFGVSLGAAVALAVAADRTDIAGVVLDSPFADFASASISQMSRLGLPGEMLQKPALKLAERLSHAHFAAVAPQRVLPAVGCQVLMILPGADLFVSGEGRRQLTAAMSIRSATHPNDVLWTIPDVAHLMPLVAFPAEYAGRVAAFCMGLPTRESLIPPSA